MENSRFKFRAWDKTNNRFVNHNQWLNNTEVSASVLVQSILTINHQGWVIMQYTGLKDKNGVEIYEGDIVKIGIDFGFRKRIILNGTQALFGEVLFDKCSFIYRHKSQGDISLFGIDNNDWCEVVGNIYENQEILKG